MMERACVPGPLPVRRLCAVFDRTGNPKSCSGRDGSGCASERRLLRLDGQGERAFGLRVPRAEAGWVPAQRCPGRAAAARGAEVEALPQ